MCDLADATAWVAAILRATLLGENEDAMKRIKSYYPVTMSIDDDPITLHVRRMSTVEMEDFEAKMRGFGYAFDGTVVQPPDPTSSREMAAWLVEVISKNVSLPAGQIAIEDEVGKDVELRTGAELVAQFGGRVDFIPTLVAYIWGENRLPEKRKVLFRDTASAAVNGVLSPEPPEPEPPKSEDRETVDAPQSGDPAVLPFSMGSTKVS